MKVWDKHFSKTEGYGTYFSVTKGGCAEKDARKGGKSQIMKDLLC